MAILEPLLKNIIEACAPIPCLIGAEEAVAKTTAPPRIVFEPTVEGYEGPHGQGPGVQQRRLLARAMTVRVHVWGKTLGHAEDLVEVAWNAIHKTAPGSYRPGRGVWKGGAITDRGAAIVFEVVFLGQITRNVGTTAEILSMTVAPELDVDPTTPGVST